MTEASSPAPINADALCDAYLATAETLMRDVLRGNRTVLAAAAVRVADAVAADRLIHVYGPGGHANLAAQEIFYRAGGLMHVSAILDEGTMLSRGALRSTAMERLPGYGALVIAGQGLGEGDLLLLVNAYGINAAVIDAALEARRRGAFVIGLSSRRHAEATAPDHPARHPTQQNLHAVVDIAIDTMVPVGDTGVTVPGVAGGVASLSTFANAVALNALVISAVAQLASRGIEPPIWRSGNAAGGDAANARALGHLRHRVPAL